MIKKKNKSELAQFEIIHYANTLETIIIVDEKAEQAFFSRLDKAMVKAENEKGFWLWKFVASFEASLLVFGIVREFAAFRKKKRKERENGLF